MFDQSCEDSGALSRHECDRFKVKRKKEREREREKERIYSRYQLEND